MIFLLLILLGDIVTGGRETQVKYDTCEDGYIDCASMSHMCHSAHVQEVLHMLTHCRQTCHNSFNNRPLTDVVTMLGGVNNTVLDIFGHNMNVCSGNQGVDSTLRYSLLRHRLATVLQPEWIPSFTEEGWKMMDVPSRLLGMINIARMKGMAEMEEEVCLAQVAPFNCQKLVEDKKECKLPQHSGRQMMIPLTQQLKDTIMEVLHPLAEEWSSMKLLGSSVYGIRRYKTGSWLATHVDRMDTHVISVIINVAQKTRGSSTWPLHIANHDGGQTQVRLSPGQMLFYESAKLPHGRPEVLTGEYYDNIFVHFKPASKTWWRIGGVRWDLSELPPWKIEIESSASDSKYRKLKKYSVKIIN